MQEEEIQDLVYKYLNDTATLQEREQLLNWYRAATPGHDVEWLASVNDEEELLKASMLKYIKSQAGIERTAPAAKLWPRIAIAAAAVAAIVFGLFFFKAPSNPEPSSGSKNYTNDIAPGKNTATLTLANGKTIILSDVKTGVIVGVNKLSYNDGSVINDPSLAKAISPQGSERIETLTAATPRGGTYQITLPDGSRAWLNADTKISFPSQFIGKDRKILLINGEVYFEVTKNREKPFIVETSRQVVEVLGTHFNISAYKDEGSTKTTLLEGSVAVTSTRARPKKPNERAIVYPGTVLKPNQESVLNENNELVLKQVDASEAVLWKAGKFGFASEEIGSIMKQVSRWYDVDVVYQDNVQQIKVTGSVSRFANISVLLEKLEQTGLVHFKVEGRKVIVSK